MVKNALVCSQHSSFGLSSTVYCTSNASFVSWFFFRPQMRTEAKPAHKMLRFSGTVDNGHAQKKSKKQGF